MSPTPCALYEPGPVPDRCARCGAAKEPHRSLPPTLTPQRKPSARYEPTDERDIALHMQDATLAACFAQGLTEAETIRLLAERHRDVMAARLREIETTALPMRVTVDPPPSLAPDPFAAWRALSADRRAACVATHRQLAIECHRTADFWRRSSRARDIERTEQADRAAREHRAEADALEALAAGRRP